MRVAFVSPMPPSASGIADYSQALVEPLGRLVELEVFDGRRPFDAAGFDAVLYQVGNNPCHGFVYEAALRHAGIVVLHEANLHHLIASVTIGREDWDGYVKACAAEGGSEARAYAERVRRLERPPDYDGLPMMRRLLAKAGGVVVHSHYMLEQVRAQGYKGPVARIPHGAWTPQVDRHAWRWRLGVEESTPLIGIFGYLKPYKRIAEALRAFRRLVKVDPRVKLILVGEPHPGLPVGELIRSLGLEAHARVAGHVPIEDFSGYMAACDIVLNLRYPTVGETSGSMLRAMGLGRAVVVSDVGAFSELPEEICLKAPVGAGEEDLLFEYLSLLVSRPDLAVAMGSRARAYVECECRWDAVAARYAGVLAGEWGDAGTRRHGDAERGRRGDAEKIETTYVMGWASDRAARAYVETHQDRMVRTLEMVPAGGPGDRVLEMGAYLQITPALKARLGYGEVRGCYYGAPGRVDRRVVESEDGERFECLIDHFDAERDAFPYPDGHFATVLCCELIEHLAADPMHMMGEILRILRPGGHLLLTTPNLASLRAVAAILQGYHPGWFHAYLRPGEPAARHNREYTPREIQLLLENCGFEVERLETGPFRAEPHPELAWVRDLLERYRLETTLRGEGIYALGRKSGAVRERYPEWLYG